MNEYWLDYAGSTHTLYGNNIEEVLVKWCEDENCIDDMQSIVVKIYDVGEDINEEYRITGAWQHIFEVQKEEI